jgi:dTDP-4-dehydrorhamnose reductase
MRFLITGCKGQLGQQWVHFLEAIKAEYTAYDSRTLDITDPQKLRDIIARDNPQVMINCAAYTKVDQAEDDKERADLINHASLENLAKQCAKHSIKLVHYSTDYVFSGEAQDREKFPNGYPENAATNPINHYGKSKLKGEQAIQQSDAQHLILRVSWLCGAYGNNFVKTMLRLAQDRDSLSVVNDQFGVPTFCSAVVEQTMKLLENKAEGIFHLGSEGIISWYDFARRIFELSGVEVQLKEVSSSEFKTKAKRPHFSKLNTTKVEQALNESGLHWESGLVQLLKTINS